MKKKQNFKKNRHLCRLLIVTIFALIMTFPSLLMADGAAKQEKFEIYIPTLPAGFGSYIMGVALAEQINKNSTWLKATAMEGRGPAENMKTLIKKPAKRKNYLFFNTTWDIWEAKKGIGPYKNFPFDYDEFRFVTLLGVGGNGLCTLNPQIKSLKNLPGKRATFDSSKGKSRDIAIRGIMEAGNISTDQIKFQYAAGKGAADTLRDGMVDVIYTGHMLKKLPATWANSPFQSELVSTKDVYYISFDKTAVYAFKKKTGHPLSLSQVSPKMLGPLQTESCNILAKPLGFCAHITMPDHVVKEILRVVYENASAFKEYTVMGNIITQDTMASLGIPKDGYHPAAVKFFKEKSVPITGFGIK
ncbi:MAG: hypothetical protein KAQ72_08325 [Desulfobacula sp.]|nr:hypothetical protein [Desulfobacula sp.]